MQRCKACASLYNCQCRRALGHGRCTALVTAGIHRALHIHEHMHMVHRGHVQEYNAKKFQAVA